MSAAYTNPPSISDEEYCFFFIDMWREYQLICNRLDRSTTGLDTLTDYTIKGALLRKFVSQKYVDQCSIPNVADAMLRIHKGTSSCAAKGIEERLKMVRAIFSYETGTKREIVVGIASTSSARPRSSPVFRTDASINNAVESVVYSSGVHGRRDRHEAKQSIKNIDVVLGVWVTYVATVGDLLAALISRCSCQPAVVH